MTGTGLKFIPGQPISCGTCPLLWPNRIPMSQTILISRFLLGVIHRPRPHHPRRTSRRPAAASTFSPPASASLPLVPRPPPNSSGAARFSTLDGPPLADLATSGSPPEDAARRRCSCTTRPRRGRPSTSPSGSTSRLDPCVTYGVGAPSHHGGSSIGRYDGLWATTRPSAAKGRSGGADPLPRSMAGFLLCRLLHGGPVSLGNGRYGSDLSQVILSWPAISLDLPRSF